MAVIEWQDELSVGIAEFDEDHKQLINLINELWEANERTGTLGAVPRIMSRLVDYVDFHFKREEQLFAKWDFPGQERHLANHRRLCETVEKLRGDIAGAVPAEVFDFLRDWLIKHILGEDMIYAAYFRAIGVDRVDAVASVKPGRNSPAWLPALGAAAISVAGAAIAATADGAAAWAGVALTAAAGIGLTAALGALVDGPARGLTAALKRLAVRDLAEGPTIGGTIGEAGFYASMLRAGIADLLEKGSKSQEILKDAEKEVRQNLLEMSDQLENEINGTVTDVTDRSTRLCHIAETMRHQATYVGEQNRSVAAAARSATENVADVSRSATELLDSIRDIQAEAHQSNAVAREATAEVERTTQVIAGLSDASLRIGAIVELINTIARQTNMLALNATIEAARAGEAGKGFAVVAEEVKGLAQKTTTSTAEIEQLIASIQGVVTEAVEAIEKVDSTIQRINAASAQMALSAESQAAAAVGITEMAERAASETTLVTSTIRQLSEKATEAEQLSSLVLDTVSGVSEHVQLMRDHLVETLRGSFAGDRRRHPRVEVDCGAIITAAGTRHQGRVHDLSIGGAMVDAGDDTLHAGSSVLFRLDGFDREIQARVLRVSAKGTHLQFDSDAEMERDLSFWLARARAQGGTRARAGATVDDGDVTLF